MLKFTKIFQWGIPLMLIVAVLFAGGVLAQSNVSYSSGGGAIPDDGDAVNPPNELISTINVAESGALQSLTVNLDINHPTAGDVFARLEHVPTGRSARLINWTGVNTVGNPGCQNDGFAITISAAGAINLDNYDCGDNASTITGTFAPYTNPGANPPDQGFAAFDGIDISGEWRLYALDYFAGDTGTVANWQLNLTYDPTETGITVTGASGLAVPNLGTVVAYTGQAQPVYQSPAGGVIRRANINELWIPNDADNNGSDEYVVTQLAVVNASEVWVAIFLGSSDWGWVPLAEVTPASFFNEDALIAAAQEAITTDDEGDSVEVIAGGALTASADRDGNADVPVARTQTTVMYFGGGGAAASTNRDWKGMR